MSLEHKPATPSREPGHFANLIAREKLSPLQAARILSVSRSMVYRLIEQEKLLASKVGGRWLVYRHSVEKILQEQLNVLA